MTQPVVVLVCIQEQEEMLQGTVMDDEVYRLWMDDGGRCRSAFIELGEAMMERRKVQHALLS